MATKRKNQAARKSKEDMISPETLEAIQEDVGELYKEHEAEIRQVMDESEKPVVVVGFGVKIDLSESEPIVETSIRFSQTVTDRRVRKLDDPKQPLLLTKEQLAAAKRGPGRPRKVATEEAAESDGAGSPPE